MFKVFVLILTLFNSNGEINQLAATQHLNSDHEKVFYISMEDCEKWKKEEMVSLNMQSEDGKNFKYEIGCYELPWDVKSGSI